MLQSGESIRAFLACSPSAEVRSQIASLQETWKRQIPAGVVSWVKPESIHLTLKFLGNISFSQKDILQSLIHGAIKTISPFHLSVEGVGAFPAPSRPKVIWAGLKGETETLLDLQRRIDKTMAMMGFAVEDRPFQWHLTMGRVKKAPAPKEIEQCLSLAHSFQGGQFQVDHISLFKSNLTPDGAIYTSLHTFPLG